MSRSFVEGTWTGKLGDLTLRFHDHVLRSFRVSKFRIVTWKEIWREGCSRNENREDTNQVWDSSPMPGLSHKVAFLLLKGCGDRGGEWVSGYELPSLMGRATYPQLWDGKSEATRKVSGKSPPTWVLCQFCLPTTHVFKSYPLATQMTLSRNSVIEDVN